MATTPTTLPQPLSVALDIVRNVFTQAGLPLKAFTQEDNHGFVVDLKDPLFEGAVAYIVASEQRFVYAVDFREKGSPQTLLAMAEFLARANYGLLIGSFEMDFEDGSARFRCGLDYEGDQLSEALVRNMAASATDTCNHYGPALVNVMSGVQSALEAIQEIESQDTEA